MMPVVLAIANEAKSFEDCIRTAIAIGGDTDTPGAVVGAIAEALYGHEDEEFLNMAGEALAYLDLDALIVAKAFAEQYYAPEEAVCLLIDEAVQRRQEGRLPYGAYSPAIECGLNRFVEAQEPVWAQVLTELELGSKQTHWMWFVFPQIKGLGFSNRARYYAIESRMEAQGYIEHPLLSERLRTVSQILWHHLKQGKTLSEVLGNHIDLMKLHSSMTLFFEKAREESDKCLYDALMAQAGAELGLDTPQGDPYTLDSIRPPLEPHPIYG